ncbi:hypothetical protein Tco_0401153 [Tanacetum coccineum]
MFRAIVVIGPQYPLDLDNDDVYSRIGDFSEDGDDDDGDSHRDDADDEDEDEEDEDEEEEEHLAPDDSTVVVPTVDLITVRLQASISLTPEAEVERLLAMPTLPPSLIISLSPPSAGERLARCTAPSIDSSPPFMPSPLLPLSRYEVGESYTARPTGGRGGYLVDPAEQFVEIAPMTVGKVNTRVTELAELHEHDTKDLYALLKDAQDSRTRISQ